MKRRNWAKLIRLIQERLTSDLLKPPYLPPDLTEDACVVLEGHCYVACEALYHMGAGASGFKPRVLSHEQWPALKPGQTHWFLSDGTTVLDPTAGQFKSDPPYDRGRRCGFLTKQPSKRAWTLMERIRCQKLLIAHP